MKLIPFYAFAASLLVVAPAMAQNLDLSGTSGAPPGGPPVPIQITASQAINWSQTAHTVTAIGNAKAVRGDVTVTADQLIAHYIEAKSNPPRSGSTSTTPATTGSAAAASTAATNADDDSLGQGNTKLTQLDAVGHVHIYTATDNAWGDHAVYSTGQQVLVLTGKNLKLTTPKNTVTARDSIEYYTAQHEAIARGNARVVSDDGRTISADVIIGYFSTQPGNQAGNQPGQVASGNLEKVDAIGNVVITTKADVASGDKGVYLPATGEARLAGNVHITHDGNQLSGSDALVNIKTGTATLLAAPGGQVSGVILPGTGKATK